MFMHNRFIINEYLGISMSQKTIKHIASSNQSLGTIAVKNPGATAIFRKLKLDFCCGGHQTLESACLEKGLNASKVIDEIHMLDQKDLLPLEPTAPDLIKHILNRYHEEHRKQLPELIRMARRVEAVHRENPQAPKGLAEHLQKMKQELFAHMDKEEKILFPMLKAGRNSMVVQPIDMMRLEHVNHGIQIEKLSNLTSNHQPPKGACNTWQALYVGTARFVDDLIEHIHTENNLLFPQFESHLSQSH
jgi:regulator of cell morphogenesis and NO signaling